MLNRNVDKCHAICYELPSTFHYHMQINMYQGECRLCIQGSQQRASRIHCSKTQHLFLQHHRPHPCHQHPPTSPCTDGQLEKSVGELFLLRAWETGLGTTVWNHSPTEDGGGKKEYVLFKRERKRKGTSVSTTAEGGKGEESGHRGLDVERGQAHSLTAGKAFLLGRTTGVGICPSRAQAVRVLSLASLPLCPSLPLLSPSKSQSWTSRPL